MMRHRWLAVCLLMLCGVPSAALTAAPTQTLSLTTGDNGSNSPNLVTVRYCDGRVWATTWEFNAATTTYAKSVPTGDVSSLQIDHYHGNSDLWYLAAINLGGQAWPGVDLTAFDGNDHDSTISGLKRIITKTFSLVCPTLPTSCANVDLTGLATQATVNTININTAVTKTAVTTGASSLASIKTAVGSPAQASALSGLATQATVDAININTAVTKTAVTTGASSLASIKTAVGVLPTSCADVDVSSLATQTTVDTINTNAAATNTAVADIDSRLTGANGLASIKSGVDAIVPRFDALFNATFSCNTVNGARIHRWCALRQSRK